MNAPSINYIAVILATLSSMVVGSIWYTPKVFGNYWMKAAGITPYRVHANEGLSDKDAAENVRRITGSQGAALVLDFVGYQPTIDTAMAEGFEFVAMGRGLLRTPDLVRRMQENPVEPDRCTHCNLCMPTIYTRTHCPVAEAG